MSIKRKKITVKKKQTSPRKNPLLIGLITIVMVCALFFGTYFANRQQNVITLGLNAELSGELAAVGKSSEQGTELAIRHINDKGGVTINGKQHKLLLTVKDNQSNQEKAAQVTQQFSKEDVTAIIGPNASKFAIAAAETAEKNKILMISPWSTNPLTTVLPDGKTKTYVFRTAYLDSFQGKSLADFAYHSLNKRRAAVVYDETADVLTKQAEYFINSFEEIGGYTTFQLGFNPQQTNYQELVRTLATYNSDVIFLPAYYKEAAAFVTAAKTQGITTPILGTDAWESNEILSLCGDNCNGNYVSAHFAPDDPDPLIQSFVKKYQLSFGETPDDVAALSYDSVGLLVKAMENCQCTTREGLISGMHLIQSYTG